MKTAVVILNWNGKNFLEKFLPGLVASVEGMDASVVVADNASTDGSLELIQERFPEVRTIVFDQNYGFTGGYNRAFEALKEDAPEYFLLINSDIEVTPDWLYPLEEWMDLHEDCAACAPKLLCWQEGMRDSFEYAGAAGGWLDHYGYPFCRGRVMKRLEKDEGQYDAPEDVLWASGACLMFRSEAWAELEGLDERFFAHMEEIDLCWRARTEGWRINVVPRSVVYHVGGGTLPQDSPFKLFLNYRNNLLMLENNLPYTFALQNLYDVLSTFAAESAIYPDDVRNCLETIDGMEDPDLDKIVATCASDACARSRRRIRHRRWLDLCSAAVYLLQGRKDYFKAVLDAHREYRKLNDRVTKQELIDYINDDLDYEGAIATNMLSIDLNAKIGERVKVKGILDEMIILLNFTQKDKIFDYLRERIG
ncbi:MAG: glycosyltransferase family 2 protein [Bacteroidales bacterium]|nr:glycosyltransferase family 2 protein [Bacteroidales bacterium]